MPTPRRAVLLCGSARALLAAVARELAPLAVPLLIQAGAADRAAAERLCRALTHRGARATVIGCELGGERESGRLVSAAWAAGGAVAAVVICPAVPEARGASGPGLERWRGGLAAGLRAPFFLAKHVGLRLRRAGGGRVILAVGGTPRQAAAMANVIRPGLRIMVDGLAKALPADVAVMAAFGRPHVAGRSAVTELARAVRILVTDAPPVSGTVVELGEGVHQG